MATIVFACGGDATTEPNATSHWSSTSGTVTKSTTHVQTGSNALKMLASNNAKVTHTLSAGQRGLVARFSVWLPATPTGNATILEWNDGVGTRILYRDPDTFIWLDFEQSLSAFPLDQWVTIDLKLDTTANPHVWNWKINGVAQTQKTRAAVASDIVSITYRAQDTGLDTWFDNIGISYTAADYPIPAGTVTGTAPEVWTPNSVTAAPTAGALVLTGATPTVSTPVAVAPTAGSLVLTGSTPTVSTPVSVAPTAGTLVLTGSTPAVTVGDAVHVTPGAAHLTLTGAVPVVTVSSSDQPHRGGRRFVGPVNQLPDLPPIRLPQPKYVRPRPAHLGLVGAVPAVTIIDDAELLAILSMIA